MEWFSTPSQAKPTPTTTDRQKERQAGSRQITSKRTHPHTHTHTTTTDARPKQQPNNKHPDHCSYLIAERVLIQPENFPGHDSRHDTIDGSSRHVEVVGRSACLSTYWSVLYGRNQPETVKEDNILVRTKPPPVQFGFLRKRRSMEVFKSAHFSSSSTNDLSEFLLCSTRPSRRTCHDTRERPNHDQLSNMSEHK